MTMVRACGVTLWSRCGLATLLFAAFIGVAAAQKVPEAKKVWTVGPLVKPQTVGSFSIGAGGVALGGMHTDLRRASTFAAMRSVVFAGDRIVVSASLGMRTLEGWPTPVRVCQLDITRHPDRSCQGSARFPDCVTLPIFATSDGHESCRVRSVLRLAPDLKDAGSFDYAPQGTSSDACKTYRLMGRRWGIRRGLRFELLDTRTL